MEFKDNLSVAVGGIDRDDVGSIREIPGRGKTAVRMRETLDASSFGNGGSQEYTTEAGFDEVVAAYVPASPLHLTLAEGGRLVLDATDVVETKPSRSGGTLVRMGRTRSTSSFSGGQGVEYGVVEDEASVRAAAGL